MGPDWEIEKPNSLTNSAGLRARKNGKIWGRRETPAIKIFPPDRQTGNNLENWVDLTYTQSGRVERDHPDKDLKWQGWKEITRWQRVERDHPDKETTCTSRDRQSAQARVTWGTRYREYRDSGGRRASGNEMYRDSIEWTTWFDRNVYGKHAMRNEWSSSMYRNRGSERIDKDDNNDLLPNITSLIAHE